jgi:RNA recognition motif-containing protein
VSIFVGNLPFRAEQEDVSELFSPFGEVTSCALPLERDTGRKRGFAFVEMADEEAESKAIDALQGAELMGRPLRINKAEPRGSGGGGGGGARRTGGGYGGGYGGGGGYGLSLIHI